MKILYYPGCTLKTDAVSFEESALLAFQKLGVELEELKRWNCCGTVFSFTTDNVMYHLAPLRNLLRVREEGGEAVFTLCSMCYNTLKRANRLFRDDPEKRDKIKNIMYQEEREYDGKARVVHALELLRDEIGLDALREKTGDRLSNLRLAPYYGCMLLRPDGLGVDDAEDPSVFEDVIRAMGAEAVDFPFRGECCGAYQTVEQPEVVAERTWAILDAAKGCGAHALVVSCPLCAFNLDKRQEITSHLHPEFESMPVLYLTEVLCLALGIPFGDRWRKEHYATVEPVLNRVLEVSGKSG